MRAAAWFLPKCSQRAGARGAIREFLAGLSGEGRWYIGRISCAGGVAEWLKAHAWKACIRETVSWVRIPLPPPSWRLSDPETWVTERTKDMGDNLVPNGLSMVCKVLCSRSI